MSNEATNEPWRTIVGRPRIWQGVGLTLLGALWLTLAAFGSEPWRWIVGAAWVVIGVLLLSVAVFDRRHGRGRYAATPLVVRAPERPVDVTGSSQR